MNKQSCNFLCIRIPPLSLFLPFPYGWLGYSRGKACGGNAATACAPIQVITSMKAKTSCCRMMSYLFSEKQRYDGVKRYGENFKKRT
jgi:hypothetical protein